MLSHRSLESSCNLVTFDGGITDMNPEDLSALTTHHSGTVL